MPLVLHLCQRAVILQPARTERTLYGRLFHPGQAGVHIQRRRRRVLPGQFGAKPRRPFQLLCALFQCGLLLPQDTPQRLHSPASTGSDDRKRHIQHPQHPDEPESADVLFRVITVVVARQPGGIQKSFFFIEADIGGRHPALFRKPV